MSFGRSVSILDTLFYLSFTCKSIVREQFGHPVLKFSSKFGHPSSKSWLTPWWPDAYIMNQRLHNTDINAVSMVTWLYFVSPYSQFVHTLHRNNISFKQSQNLGRLTLPLQPSNETPSKETAVVLFSGRLIICWVVPLDSITFLMQPAKRSLVGPRLKKNNWGNV